MTREGINRRQFTAGATALGAMAAAGCKFDLEPTTRQKPDLAVAHGPDLVKDIDAAVEAAGGWGAYVGGGQVVGILVSILGAVPSAHTKPDVIRTVVARCREAGAKEVRIMDWREMDRWQQNKLIEVVRETQVTFQHIGMDDPKLWRSVDVPRGKALNKVRLFEVMFEPDVFITLPIFKHHGGAKFTGALKLYMGTTHREDNRRTFHRERGVYLEQCIADLNTAVRPPDLIIMDAFETITTRGPVGPGNVITPRKIVVGTDRVAIDAYCAPILGVNPADSIQIREAHAHGIGEMDVGKLNIKELEVGV